MGRGPIPDKAATRPTVPEVQPLASAYYNLRPENSCGGNLHIVLDDGNMEDDSIIYCRDRAKERADRPGELLAEVMLHMTRTQRRQIDGYGHVHMAAGEIEAECERLLARL